jgi:hypothetical protein
VRLADDCRSMDRDFLAINCGRCGTSLKFGVADLRDARFVECEAAAQHAAGVCRVSGTR